MHTYIHHTQGSPHTPSEHTHTHTHTHYSQIHEDDTTLHSVETPRNSRGQPSRETHSSTKQYDTDTAVDAQAVRRRATSPPLAPALGMAFHLKVTLKQHRTIHTCHANSINILTPQPHDIYPQDAILAAMKPKLEAMVRSVVKKALRDLTPNVLGSLDEDPLETDPLS